MNALVTPTAVQIAPPGLEQEDRETWLKVRQQGIGSSDVAAILGLSPWESPFSLWHRKAGNIPPKTQNRGMRWGRLLEEVVCQEWVARRPEMSIRYAGTLAHVDRPWQLANPDRFAFQTGSTGTAEEIVEAKTDYRSDVWGPDGSDEIPIYYRAQVMWQMDVTGIRITNIPVLISGSDFRQYRIEYDTKEATFIRERAEEFQASILAGKAPKLDDSLYTAQALRQLHPTVEDINVEIPVTLAIAYDDACQQYAKAVKAKQQATNEMLAAIGTGRGATCDNHLIATRIVYDETRVDVKRLKVERGDDIADYLDTTTKVQLRPAQKLGE